MLEGRRFFALFTFLAFVVAFSFPFIAQARNPTVLVINTSSDQYGRCCPAFAQAPSEVGFATGMA